MQRETSENVQHMETEHHISKSLQAQSDQESTPNLLQSDTPISNHPVKNIASADETSVLVDGRSFAGVVKAATVPVIKTTHTQPSEILKSMFAPKPSLFVDSPSITAEHTPTDTLHELYLRKAKALKTNDLRTKTKPYPISSPSSIKDSS